MTEADEIAAAILAARPALSGELSSLREARRLAAAEMPDEGTVQIDNVARALVNASALAAARKRLLRGIGPPSDEFGEL